MSSPITPFPAQRSVTLVVGPGPFPVPLAPAMESTIRQFVRCDRAWTELLERAADHGRGDPEDLFHQAWTTSGVWEPGWLKGPLRMLLVVPPEVVRVALTRAGYLLRRDLPPAWSWRVARAIELALYAHSPPRTGVDSPRRRRSVRPACPRGRRLLGARWTGVPDPRDEAFRRAMESVISLSNEPPRRAELRYRASLFGVCGPEVVRLLGDASSPSPRDRPRLDELGPLVPLIRSLWGPGSTRDVRQTGEFAVP